MNDNKNITDTELDALFKNAEAAGSVPAFDDAFWTEMEAMLPAKKRVGVIFWWTSGAALVLGIAILIGVTQFDHEVAFARGRHLAPAEVENQDNGSTDQKTVTPNENDESVSANDHDITEKNSMKTRSITSISSPAPLRERTQIRNKNKTGSFQGNDDIPEKNVVETPSIAFNPADSNEKTETPKTEYTFAANADLTKKGFVFTEPIVLNDVQVDRSTGNGFPIYSEFAIGYGQSYKRITFSNNWATQFRFTVGLTKEVPGMQLSAGLALRAEMPNNLSYVRTENGSTSSVNEYRGLYSVEFPMEAMGKFGRNGLGLLFVPGIQLGYTGNRSYYQNSELMTRERSSGTMESAKTMTMECGLKYAYDISEYLQFTSSCTFDMVRPFQSAYYQGDNQDYPVTFFVGLRKKF